MLNKEMSRSDFYLSKNNRIARNYTDYITQVQKMEESIDNFARTTADGLTRFEDEVAKLRICADEFIPDSVLK